MHVRSSCSFLEGGYHMTNRTHDLPQKMPHVPDGLVPFFLFDAFTHATVVPDDITARRTSTSSILHHFWRPVAPHRLAAPPAHAASTCHASAAPIFLDFDTPPPAPPIARQPPAASAAPLPPRHTAGPWPAPGQNRCPVQPSSKVRRTKEPPNPDNPGTLTIGEH